jgi:hypothetical protein
MNFSTLVIDKIDKNMDLLENNPTIIEEFKCTLFAKCEGMHD